MGPAREKKQARREEVRGEKISRRSSNPPLQLCYIYKVWTVSVKKAEKREMDEGDGLKRGFRHLVH